ncbi:MAG: hypothetical protein CVV30_06390 [Methanomicrobiales archaeon HGW-Methanomicrobiales-1]|jgi:hypothetical protein|nr:MAG: hypothetical protein CVV30_06390 [Methanomicrobiales archaeon HGW-Methanomicrobiales-1]
MGIGLEFQRDAVGPEQSGAVKEETEISELEWARRHQASLQPELKDRQDDGEQGTDCSGKNGAVPGHFESRRTATAGKNPVKPVERKTGLRGQAIAPGKNPKIRRQAIIRELMENNSDIPYAAVEKANQDLICSLIERQDRAIEGVLLLITDMQYRLDDLEDAGRSG